MAVCEHVCGRCAQGFTCYSESCLVPKACLCCRCLHDLGIYYDWDDKRTKLVVFSSDVTVRQ